MKKILLILSVLIIGVELFFLFGSNKEFKKINNTMNELGVGEKNSDQLSYKLEDLEFSYLKNDIGDFNMKVYEGENNKVIYVELPVKNTLLTNNLYKKSIPNLSIYVTKDVNKKKLSVDEWLDIEDNNPENDKGAPISYKQEAVLISNEIGVKHYFASGSDVYFNSYESVTLYIPHKADIYQINYYKMADTSESKQDLEDIKNYEKVVGQIIQSIRFVN